MTIENYYNLIFPELKREYRKNIASFETNRFSSVYLSNIGLIVTLFKQNFSDVEFLTNNNYLDLRETFGKHRLNLLHIASITNCSFLTKYILTHNKELNQPDNKNWLPIHHAALLENMDIIALISSIFSNSLKNDLNLTFENILEMIQKIPDDNDEIIPLNFQDSVGKITKLTRKEFFRLTGSHFSEKIMTTKTFLFNEWENEEHNIPDNLIALNDKAQGHKDLPDLKSLYIKKISRELGVGLYTDTAINKGDYIGKYTGVLYRGFPKNNYQLENVDAYEIKNGLALVNDGFPSIVDCPLLIGNLSSCIFLAGENIKAHTQLLWNYGLHNAKLGPYKEFAKEETRLFFKNNSIKDLYFFYHNYRQLPIEEQIYNIDSELIIRRFFYLLDTPPVLFNLVYEGIINEKDAGGCQILLKGGNKYKEYNLSSLSEVPIIALECRKVQGILSNHSQLLAKKYNDFFLTSNENYGIHITLKKAKMANHLIERWIKNSSTFSEEEMKEKLNKIFKSSSNELFWHKFLQNYFNTFSECEDTSHEIT